MSQGHLGCFLDIKITSLQNSVMDKTKFCNDLQKTGSFQINYRLKFTKLISPRHKVVSRLSDSIQKPTINGF